MEEREKVIIETLENKGREGLKETNVTSEEKDELVNSIDKKIKMLNMEETLAVSKELGYNLPIDFCVFYSKQMNLHIKTNMFKVNGSEKIINTLLSMDKDSKYFILNFQVSDSQNKDRLLAFALLEFGDSLCFDKNDNSIVYYNHELDDFDKVANSWKEFEGMLYIYE